MQSGSSLHGCRRVPAARLCAGFTLVEVLVALFVVALGIAGAAGLQTLAVRTGRDAMLLSDATRLARSLASPLDCRPSIRTRCVPISRRESERRGPYDDAARCATGDAAGRP